MLALTAMAQKEFTLEDLNFGGNNYRNMVPQNRSLAWWGDLLIRLADDTCWTVNTANGKEKILFTRADINNDQRIDISDINALIDIILSSTPPENPKDPATTEDP